MNPRSIVLILLAVLTVLGVVSYASDADGHVLLGWYAGVSPHPRFCWDCHSFDVDSNWDSYWYDTNWCGQYSFYFDSYGYYYWPRYVIYDRPVVYRYRYEPDVIRYDFPSRHKHDHWYVDRPDYPTDGSYRYKDDAPTGYLRAKPLTTNDLSREKTKIYYERGTDFAGHDKATITRSKETGYSVPTLNKFYKSTDGRVKSGSPAGTSIKPDQQRSTSSNRSVTEKPSSSTLRKPTEGYGGTTAPSATEKTQNARIKESTPPVKKVTEEDPSTPRVKSDEEAPAKSQPARVYDEAPRGRSSAPATRSSGSGGSGSPSKSGSRSRSK